MREGRLLQLQNWVFPTLKLETSLFTQNLLFERLFPLIHYVTKEDPYLEAAGQKSIHMMNEFSSAMYA